RKLHRWLAHFSCCRFAEFQPRIKNPLGEHTVITVAPCLQDKKSTVTPPKHVRFVRLSPLSGRAATAQSSVSTPDKSMHESIGTPTDPPRSLWKEYLEPK